MSAAADKRFAAKVFYILLTAIIAAGAALDLAARRLCP
jgi:hypothetical protein